MVDMEGGRNGERPPEEQLQPPQPHKCPRCDSFNTKFCYYNNYSLSQPRYFCKACRRYWTQGGTLRNVPIGGGCRKSKRARTTSSNSLPPAVRAQSFDQRLVASPMSNTLFLSSLAAMHSLPGNLCGGGGQIGGNKSLPSDLKSSITFQPPSTLYSPPHSSLIPPGSFNSWTQALINTGGAASSSSASASSFWSSNDRTSSSFAPNTHPGFKPSQ